MARSIQFGADILKIGGNELFSELIQPLTFTINSHFHGRMPLFL